MSDVDDNTMSPKWVHPSTGEAVELERWCWEADYRNGYTLRQFDYETGVFHQFKEIDQSRLVRFRMVCTDSYMFGEQEFPVAPPFVIEWDSSYKLVHFYKNFILRFGTPEELRIKLYCFGYETCGHKVIFAIMPDNQIILAVDAELIKVD